MDLSLAFFSELARWATFALMAGVTAILFATHRRSRATVFTDVAVRAAALVLTILYLTYISANARALHADPTLLGAVVNFVMLLFAAGFLTVAINLWRFATRTDGAVIVTPEFLVGLRTRMGAMYGPTSASFVAYAVGKESARKAVDTMISSGFVSRGTLWKRLPRWFRLMGYGGLSYASAPREGDDEVRLRVAGSFETAHPDPANPHGACDLTRGYLAGLGQALRPGHECEVEETHCCSREGDGDACEFTIRWFPPMDQVEVSLLLQPNRSGG